MSSRIFQPFRAIGSCSNDVPLSLTQNGRSSLVATAVGRAFHVYQCQKLHLVFISQLQDDDITCLVQDDSITYASVGEQIKIFESGKEKVTINSGRVRLLTLLGKQLLGVTEENNSLCIWNIEKRELYTELSFDKKEFLITAVSHPSTYLNKIIIGSRQGQLQLWNIRTSRLIYTFSGWGSAIMSLEQSPALDVLGVGLEDGRVLIHNVREDRTLFQFRQDWGPVYSLAFRTDGIDTLISVGRAGHMAVWDLNEKRLCCVLRDVHKGPINGLKFFNNQPVCITNSGDNSIKMWIFDQSDGSGRLLKERCGHSAPPSLIRFHPTNQNVIISAGEDRTLRVIALHRQIISRELSQGTHIKKRGQVSVQRLSPIIDFSCESHRQNEWDCLVTVHRDTPTCYTWNLINYTIGKHSINLKEKLLCCSISVCGNFMILGTVSGRVHIYNIQSGLSRGELMYKKSSAHIGPVRGVGTMLQYIITGGADSTVKIWSFQSKHLLRSVLLESPIFRLVLHKESGLVGVACDNFRVSVIDVDTGKIVRTFSGPAGRITDLLITNDSRWLLVSSVNCSITTWDIPSGHKIDLFYTETPPTSMTMSLSGNFLATSHTDELGICLWSNRTLYSTLTLTPLSENYRPSTVLPLPTTSEQEVGGDQGVEFEEDKEEKREGGPLRKGMITMSSLSKSHWHCLQYMDTIKERNKPTEPVQPVKPAPFFLPTQLGLELKFLPAPDPIPSLEDNKGSQSKLLQSLNKSAFQKCLMEYHHDNEKFAIVIDHLKSLGPAAIDLEFQLLVTPSVDQEDDLLEPLLIFILEGLRRRNNFELFQSYLCLLLKYYLIPVLSKRSDLIPLMKDLLAEHKGVWKQLSSQLNYSNTLLSYCKSATI